jgi:hypothetical protein
MYDGSSWHTIVDLTSSQVLTNKDYDGGTASNTSRLTIPSATKTTLDALTRKAGTIVYASDLQKVFLDDGSTLVEVSGSGGGTGINHITNPDAEVNTSGWNLYADAAGTEPVDGTGGSANITFNRTTTASEILRDVASFEIAKDAANRQGEGVSTDIALPQADQGKMLEVSFDYKTSANYASGDIGVYLIRDTGGTPTLVYPSTVNLPASLSSTTFKATFATTSDDDWRLAFHVASTNATAYDVFIDDVKVGPQISVQGVPQSDWISYSPTDAGLDIATDDIEYKRIGDSILIRGQFTTGTPTATEAQLGLPAGLTISHVNSSTQYVGAVQDNRTDSIGVRNYALATNGDTFLNFGRDQSNTSRTGLVAEDADAIFDAGGRFSLQVGPIAIAEWAGTSVNLSSAQPEYVYNTDSGTSSDTTSFGYGLDGANLPSAALSGNITKRVRFLTPIQPTDVMHLQIDRNGTGDWVNMNGAFQADDNSQVQVLNYTDSAGVGLSKPVSGTTTDMDVEINRYRQSGSGDWNANTGVAKWRVVKIPGTISVASPTTKRIQTKKLTADVSTTTTVSDWTFSNLTVGKWYTIQGQARLINDDGGDLFLNIYNSTDASNQVGLIAHTNDADSVGNRRVQFALNFSFRAINTSLEFRTTVSGAAILEGNNDLVESYVQLVQEDTMVEYSGW